MFPEDSQTLMCKQKHCQKILEMQRMETGGVMLGEDVKIRYTISKTNVIFSLCKRA